MSLARSNAANRGFKVGEQIVFSFPGQKRPSPTLIAELQETLIPFLKSDFEMLTFDVAGLQFIPSQMLGFLIAVRNKGRQVELLNPSDSILENNPKNYIIKFRPTSDLTLVRWRYLAVGDDGKCKTNQILLDYQEYDGSMLEGSIIHIAIEKPEQDLKRVCFSFRKIWPATIIVTGFRPTRNVTRPTLSNRVWRSLRISNRG